MKHKLIALLTLLMLLVACTGTPGDEPAVEPDADTPTSSDEAPPTEPEDAGADGQTTYISGEANVDAVNVNLLESFPVQVRLAVSGYLPDGCTEIDETAVARSDNTFDVTITTQRPADAICTQQLVSFEENIALDVAGLPAGEYTVDVNDTITSFTLDMDNVLPDEN